jgi:hypothetical protein
VVVDEFTDVNTFGEPPPVPKDEFSKKFLYIFASGWSIVTMSYIVGITFFTIPESNVRFADTVLGFLLGVVVSTMFNYFFGSSRSSVMKDRTIAEALKSSSKG